MICLVIGQSQPGIFYLQKIMIFKKDTLFSLFIKKKNYPFYSTLLNFTSLVMIQTPKMNLYGKLHFFEKLRPPPHHRTQMNIFYLGHQDNIKILNNFFLGLECFYKYPDSKINNQKTKYVLSLLLGILDCNTKMGNETAGYC